MASARENLKKIWIANPISFTDIVEAEKRIESLENGITKLKSYALNVEDTTIAGM